MPTNGPGRVLRHSPQIYLNFLFIGAEGDPHLSAVSDVLVDRGHKVTTWSTEGVFLGSAPTMGITKTPHIRGDGFEPLPDLVWARKLIYTREFTDAHEEFINDECRAVADGLLTFLESSTVMVNPFSSIMRAKSKIGQLIIAARFGAIIPKTLVTRDPSALREFWRQERGKVVCKPLVRSSVLNGQDMLVIPTYSLCSDDIESDTLISACPTMYQALVEKVREVRITIFGDYVFGAMVNPEKPEDIVDWRIMFAGGVCKKTVVPPETEGTCRQIMSELGLKYAAFDYCVDVDGEWIFLELNDSGNFLHTKSVSDEILYSFCDFVDKEAKLQRYHKDDAVSNSRLSVE